MTPIEAKLFSFSRPLPIFVFLCAGILLAGSALAQSTTTESAGKGDAHGLIPPAATVNYGAEKPSGEDTHPMLRLTPDKSELIRLDQDAESVIVGNPTHLGVLMDNRRLLILVPRQPGATYLTVLDAKGDIIMQRHVLVAVPGTDYVRIRRSCSAEALSKGCQQTSVYYCPGMCHEVGIVSDTGSGDIAPLPPSSTPAFDKTGAGDSAVPSNPDVPANGGSDMNTDENEDTGDPADAGE
ncbi:MAG TPA: pilus assembly protein N-terminal domain-containing protein [Micavibrio sp.]